jgi:hypothetical protein
MRFDRFGGALFALATVGAMVACGGSGSVSTGDDDLTKVHTAFTCDLSSGDLTTGNDFKLTLTTNTATVEWSDLGTHKGKLAKPAAGDASGSERYGISGLASDDGVTNLVIPANFRTNSRGTVKIDSSAADSKVPNSFLCHPVDPASGAPISGRGSAGPAPITGTKNVTCKLSANETDEFGSDTFDVVITADSLKLKGGDVDADGPYDATYKPRTNTSMVRYLVSDLFDEYATDVLVSKDVLAGKSGKLKIEAKGESFESAFYDCSPKK